MFAKTVTFGAVVLLAACAGTGSAKAPVSMDVPPMLSVFPGAEGFTFASGGWRLAWGESDPGAGRLIVSAQGTSGSGDGRLMQGGVRIGVSDDAGAIGNCLTFGLGEGARTLPDREIDGVAFQATANGDAGMSQQLDATSYRAVHNGQCIAIDRYTYASPRPIPEGAPNPEDITHAMDQAIASITIE